MNTKHTSDDWVSYNAQTASYETKEGTSVGAELVDNVYCLADVFHIACIREKQRAEIAASSAKATGASHVSQQ